MRAALALMLGLLAPVPALAQEVKAPIIPILVGASEKAAQVSVVVDRGLRSSKRLKRSLRVARKAMQEGEEISLPDMRALAMARDGLAAQRYVRAMQAGAVERNPSDLAYLAAIAVGTGRVWTLKPMIEAMRELDPATEPKDRINTYIRVLYPHAWAGNALALEALVLFNGEGRLFGPLSDTTRDRILAQAKKQADGRTELRLAMGILETERAKDTADAAQMAQAAAYLEAAAQSDHLDVSTTAQNLRRMIEEPDKT